MHDGPPWTRRWPVGVIGFGMAILAYFTRENTSTEFLSQPIWWVTAAIISVVCVVFMFRGGTSLRRLSAAMLIVYGGGRAVAYLMAGIETPLGVWVLVIGLVLSAYKAQERGVGDPRNVVDT